MLHTASLAPALIQARDLTKAYTMGDQVVWGAAAPLRRMLRILLND